MAEKISTTNASKKRGGNNKTGKGGFGERPQDRNTSGQRSREVVATQAQARALYVQVLHEPINAPIEPEMSNLELIVRQHVKAAKQGDAGQREQMFDRIWGKANQPVTGADGGAIQYEDVNVSDTERLERLLALADRARTRRSGNASSGAGGDSER